MEKRLTRVQKMGLIKAKLTMVSSFAEPLQAISKTSYRKRLCGRHYRAACAASRYSTIKGSSEGGIGAPYTATILWTTSPHFLRGNFG